MRTILSRLTIWNINICWQLAHHLQLLRYRHSKCICCTILYIYA